MTATAVAGGRALVVEVPLAGNGTSKVSDSALLTLENRILPCDDRQGARRELRRDREHRGEL